MTASTFWNKIQYGQTNKRLTGTKATLIVHLHAVAH